MDIRLKRARTLGVALLAATVAVVSAPSAVEAQDAPPEVTEETLAKFANVHYQITIIRDETTWQSFWSAHTLYSYPPPPLPSVNSTPSMVHAVSFLTETTRLPLLSASHRLGMNAPGSCGSCRRCSFLVAAWPSSPPALATIV